MLFRLAYRAFATLFCMGLLANAYLSHEYIADRNTTPDATHNVPFDAHGDTTYISRAESRDYNLLWLAIIVAGLLGTAAYVVDERTEKRKR